MNVPSRLPNTARPVTPTKVMLNLFQHLRKTTVPANAVLPNPFQHLRNPRAPKPECENHKAMQKHTPHTPLSIPAALLGTALFLLSCTKTEIMQDGSGEGAISFTDIGTTKAPVESFKAGDSFSVWGWRETGTAKYAVFDATEVSTADGTDWVYSGLQYWLPDCTYSFYALYPAVNDLEEGASAGCSSDGTVTVSGFDASAIGPDAVDLMTARRTGMSTQYDVTTPSPVSFTFTHALTRIRFAVKLSEDIPVGYKVSVTSLRLGAYLKGDMTYGMQTGMDWTPADNSYGSVELSAENGALTQDKIVSDGTNADPVTISSGGYELLMVPQEMSEYHSIYIAYRIENDVDSGDPGYWSIDNDATLGLSSHTAWRPGESLTYSVIISSQSVSVQLSVGDWEDGNSGNEDIGFE